VVEGGTVETAYNWKLTVGPVEQRQERFGPWMVRRTQGMGLYEYLQFCADLEAEPLWVGFAGQTCIFRRREEVPMQEMGWVRDNFLDIVEYANGPADSQWGRLRAQAGHALPFDLKYVEIGNENQGPGYGERYRFIHDALKARYPNLVYLADLSWTSRESLGDAVFDIEDRHYYNSSRWFATRFNHYDDRERSLPPLYLGEVAVTRAEAGPLRGNLLAALSEGIFLMGCERNADTVSMVSYAPLLAHVEGRTELVDAPPPWHALIYFDNTRCFGTASYYLWKLFGTHRPSFTVQTDVTLADSAPRTISGAVGVGTWGTSAEFKDLRVEKDGRVLYQSDFSASTADWRTQGGSWTVEDGAYRQTRTRNGFSTIGDEAWTDYTLSLKARKLSGNEGFLVMFGCKGRDRYWWNLGGWGNSRHALEFNQTPVGRGRRGRIESERWYDIKIELAGLQIRCYLDGELIHEASAPRQDSFFAVAGHDETTGDMVLKAINYDERPFQATLDIQGLESMNSQANLTVLTADTLNANNSLDHPRRVTPRQSLIDLSGPRFGHSFPSHSLTLLRIKTKQ